MHTTTTTSCSVLSRVTYSGWSFLVDKFNCRCLLRQRRSKSFRCWTTGGSDGLIVVRDGRWRRLCDVVVIIADTVDHVTVARPTRHRHHHEMNDVLPMTTWLLTTEHKLALITFNVLQQNNHMYLRDLLTTRNPSRNLRSSSQHLLSVSYMRTVSSSRCFKHSAAINWNDLPFDIRACDSVNVFKCKLKTHLFNIAYAT